MLKKILLCLISVAALVTLSGCFTTHHHESKMPWSRPADWEGQIPGLSR